MGFFQGIIFNLRGVAFALKTPKLLLLGLLRFLVVLIVSLLFSGLALYWTDTLMNLIWGMPEAGMLLYLWKVLSWLLAVLLVALSMVVAYLIAQIFFCVFIMDYMSRITETMILGRNDQPKPESWFTFFIYLIRQEIPRAVIPVVISLVIMVAGFLTPAGIVIMLLSSVAASVFLAWDNTDLTPARRLIPFRQRLDFLKNNILFHIGFGLLFLIPWLNIVFLSFAPVGATLYYLDREADEKG